MCIYQSDAIVTPLTILSRWTPDIESKIVPEFQIYEINAVITEQSYHETILDFPDFWICEVGPATEGNAGASWGIFQIPGTHDSKLQIEIALKSYFYKII